MAARNVLGGGGLGRGKSFVGHIAAVLRIGETVAAPFVRRALRNDEICKSDRIFQRFRTRTENRSTTPFVSGRQKYFGRFYAIDAKTSFRFIVSDDVFKVLLVGKRSFSLLTHLVDNCFDGK